MDQEIFIGRQPVFNIEGKCIAYELLYRCGTNQAEASFDDNTKAMARVIINLIHNIGIPSLVGDKTGYINVDDHILLSDAILSIPKEQFIFEILEYTKLSVAIVEKVRHFYELGYRFALDDFSCNSENIDYFKMLFPYVELVKIDVLQTPTSSLSEIVQKFKPYELKLLAEKVEDLEIFEACKKAGFEYFQGYFFEKPTLITGKKIEPTLANAIDLINTIYKTDDISSISAKFSQYPELTFNLLRYINSSAYSFRNEITSIKQILNLLGPSRLRSWLGLFLYAGSQERMFGEAIINAVKFRAKMMHELVSLHGKPAVADEAFLAGSLSLIDTYLQMSMEELLDQIQITQTIKDALLTREGYLGKVLEIVEKLEKTDQLQNMIEYLAPKLNLTPFQLYTAYWKASELEIEKGT